MSGDVDRRLAALRRAVELSEGRLEPEHVEAARTVVERAGARIDLGVETTVAALAGPTGAGKSSLFNALAGAELSSAGVRRPTTSASTAAVRGDVRPELLDWLGAARRHVLDAGPDDPPLVVLDLPDFDSVQRSHRDEVDRLVGLVDLLVWVTDPQKYADAALHDRYLRPLAGHRDVMLVVLNQADRLAPAALAACRADLGRLLAADGLEGVPLLTASALTGEGVRELRAALEERARERAAAAARLAADVTAVAAPLRATCAGRAGEVSGTDRDRVVAALAGAAGVPTVVRAVDAAHRREGKLAAGWRPARWLGRLRPDPLRRLRLGEAPDPDVHSSLPRATPVQLAQVGSAARTLAERAAGDLPAPWPARLRTVTTGSGDQMAGELDRAVTGVDLRRRRPRWWTVAALLQRVLALAAGIGALWLLGLAALGYFRLDDVLAPPEVENFPLPTLLVVGGLLAGLLLALIARRANAVGGRRRARRAQRALHRAVAEVAEVRILEPLRAELAAREEICAALDEAAGGNRSRRPRLRR